MNAMAPASSLGVLATLRRGVQVSPQLLVGWKVTLVLAMPTGLVGTAGQLVARWRGSPRS